MKIILQTTSWWRRVLPLLAGFLLVGLLVFTVATKPKLKSNSVPSTSETSPSSSKKTKDTSAFSPAPTEDLEHLSAVEKFVAGESLKVGKPDSNPQKSFEKLQAVARGLKRMDVENLKKTALNNELNNDRRFMSVYLLTLADNASTAPALMSIALDPLTIQDMSSRLYAEELMIRTQALQGLAKYQPNEGEGPLHQYLQKQDNSFLADQARRLLNEKMKRSR